MTVKEAVEVATQAQKRNVWDIEAWKVRDALLVFFAYYKASQPDEGTTMAWKYMPESPNDAYGESFKRNVDASLNEINRKIMICETNIEMLWNAVEAIKDKLPKEWGK